MLVRVSRMEKVKRLAVTVTGNIIPEKGMAKALSMCKSLDVEDFIYQFAPPGFSRGFRIVLNSPAILYIGS